MHLTSLGEHDIMITADSSQPDFPREWRGKGSPREGLTEQPGGKMAGDWGGWFGDTDGTGNRGWTETHSDFSSLAIVMPTSLLGQGKCDMGLENHRALEWADRSKICWAVLLQLSASVSRFLCLS